MRSTSKLILILCLAECLTYIQAVTNYRSLGSARRMQSNPRYRDYRTMNQHKPGNRYDLIRHQDRHVVRPRSTITDYININSQDKFHCAKKQIRIRREKKWQNINEVKRDLEVNPAPPKEVPPPEATEAPAPPKPRPKARGQKGKPKKVHVEMVKITAIDPNNQDMGPPPMMGPPSGYSGPPPGYSGPPPGYMGPMPPMMAPPGPPPFSPIPRWTQQMPPPPWAYQNSRPPWAEEQLKNWAPQSRSRPKPKDALDELLSEDALKKKSGNSEEKWPLKGDSERHRWESREGSDIYWELESTKKLATWDPMKSNGPLWKGASRSSAGGKKKWEDDLDSLVDGGKKDEWNEAEHGGVPKPPLKYLREYRRQP